MSTVQGQGEKERRMAKEQERQRQQQVGPPPTTWIEKIEAKYRKTKAHAEAYPYLWASYMMTYTTFGLYFAYKWRKLRLMEDRVRALQEQRRLQFEAEEAKEALRTGCSVIKPPSSAASSSADSKKPRKYPLSEATSFVDFIMRIRL